MKMPENLQNNVPLTKAKEEIAKKVCPIIFILDTSKSMSMEENGGIGVLNSTMENLFPEFIAIDKNNSEANVKIAILTFNTNAKWVTDGLITPQEAQDTWKPLAADGLTSLGKAFEALNQKLFTENGFMQNAMGFFAPVLFLLSDGEPTDDWQKGLNSLKNNNWYKFSIRIAIGYGKEANEKVLQSFTNNVETVFKADTLIELNKIIQFTTINATQMSSRNKNAKKVTDNTQKAADLFSAKGGKNGALNAKANEPW